MARENIKPISLEELKDDLKNRPGLGSAQEKPNSKELVYLYVARDSFVDDFANTNLYAFYDKPKKNEFGEKNEFGVWRGDDCARLDKDLFPQIKATDEEPTRVLMALEILDK